MPMQHLYYRRTSDAGDQTDAGIDYRRRRIYRSHTLLRVLGDDHEVCVIDNFSNSHPDALARVGRLSNRSFEIHETDLRNADALHDSLTAFRPDIVVHFAGLKAVV